MIIRALSVALISCFLVPLADGAAQKEGEAVPLEGPALFKFTDDAKGGLPKRQFGVFREEQPPNEQYIEDVHTRLAMPSGAKPEGFLVLAYNVSGTGAFNGFWVKLGDASWAKYSRGELVLQLRRLDPKKHEIKRKVRLREPDTECTSTIKIELKSADADGVITSVGLRQNFTAAHAAEQRKQGYFTVRLKLDDFGIDLRRMSELVLVFENNRILPNERRGALGIRGIYLTTRVGQAVGELADPDLIIDDMSWRAWRWFQKHRHPETGLVLDRGANDEASDVDPQQSGMCSIAGVGFYLSMLPEAVRLGYIADDEARQHAQIALRSVRDKVKHHEGIYYHFVDWRNGERWGNSELGSGSEVSTLDTAILLLGCGVAARRFGGSVDVTAQQVMDRANWPRFVLRDHANKHYLSLGWLPEKGLLGPCDVRSTEFAMPIFLGVAAERAIDPECWYNTRVNRGELAGVQILNPDHGLFTSQYGLLWWDLQDKVDRHGIDLFENARSTALANRRFCRAVAGEFPTYEKPAGFWGISAGDSPTGYIAPKPHRTDIDGTVWLTAALASYPWVRGELNEDLRAWRSSQHWDMICGPFGLAPFRLAPDPIWVAPDLLAIDLGSMFLSIANARNRTVWDLWMSHPAAKKALQRLKLKPNPAG